MQTLNATETGSAAKAGDLMAAWRASGGAMDGRREAAAADDGLAAMGPTGYRGCFADDGLAATAFSNRWPQCADDGLAATAYSNVRSPACADDGLEATSYSASYRPCADDGLAAMAYSNAAGCYAPAG